MIQRESIKSKTGFRLLVIIAIAVAAVSAWSRSSFAQQGGVARYIYDANGRLTAVLSPTGEAAIYQYDPAGNFTSITRRAANELSIFEFTPGAGGVGTQVTIYGTGFSDTPSANTVKFNGVTATVAAATKIQLTVNVPAGATTGPINISNANGSVNSGVNFIVAPGNLEFSYPIAFGGSVQFEFVQPPSAPVTNVGILTFNGVAGQRVSLLIEDLSCYDHQRNDPPPFAHAQISIISPSSAILASAPLQNYYLAPQAIIPYVPFAYIENVILPATGQYTILIDPNDNTTGRIICSGRFTNFGATARLYDVPPDITGTIAASGMPTPISFAAPGQIMTLTFAGLSGQRIALLGLQGTQTLGYPTEIKLYAPGTYPNGAPLFSDAMILRSFMDAMTLTASGTYTILADPAFNKTRGAELTLYDVPPDVTGSLTINGPTVPLNLLPAQNALLTFNVASTQSVVVFIEGLSLGGDGNITLSLLRSDDTVIASVTSSFVFLGLSPQTLTPGTYKVKLDPVGDNAGSAPVRLFNP